MSDDVAASEAVPAKPNKPLSGGSEALLQKAKDDFKLAEEAWAINRKNFLEDMKFRALDQWPDKVKRDREKNNRPCLVVDKINQYIRQVVNDGRQNRPGVKVHPVDDGNEEVAEAFQGIIRRICRQSVADEAFDTALDHAATGGFGYFRILTDYAHENTFDQEIEVRRIRNPRAVLLDPNIQRADGSDARFGFVIDELPKDEFKKTYPNAKFTDWQTDLPKYTGWMLGENIRFAEYFYAVDEDGELHLLADGTSIRDDDYQAAVRALGPDKVPKILETRAIPLRKVKWCRLSGAEILEESDWLGKYVPIIPVFGNEMDLDGKVIYTGLVRSAMDAMRLYNYARSAYVEYVALQPKAPWVAAAGQVQNHPEWQDANTENYSVLEYDVMDVNGIQVPPPQRSQPPTGASGWAQDMQMAEHDIQGSMGMYGESLSQETNAKSGKAIMARQREGDSATFHYHDNLNRAIAYLGRQLVDLIPKVYDSQRVIRILHEDGTTATIKIDPNQQEPVQQIGGMSIYNLNAGIYDVSVEAGPSYTTKRQEALEAGMQLAQANPQMWGLVGDIIVRNADWPGAAEIADRLKIMLPPPIQQAEQAKEGGQDPKVLAAVAPLQQAVNQLHQQIQQAEQGIAQRDQAMQQLQQQLAQAKNSDDMAGIKARAEQQKVQLERDRMALDKLKVEADEREAVLDSETKLRVAQISAGLPPETPQEQQYRVAQETQAIQQLAQAISGVFPEIMNRMDKQAQAIGTLGQGVGELHAGMNRPRVATMSDGRQVKITKNPDGTSVAVMPDGRQITVQ